MRYEHLNLKTSFKHCLLVVIRANSSFSCFDDQNQWSSVFSGIVSRAMTMEVLSTGVAGNYNGALQVVHSNCS